MEHGLRGIRKDKEQEDQPIRKRLDTIDSLLATKRKEYRNLLGLYVSGKFPEEMLDEDRENVESVIASLESERREALAYLETHTLTEDQIKNLRNFAVEVAEDLKAMEDDFAAKRRVIDALDIHVLLTVDDGEPQVGVSCWVGDADTGCNIAVML